MTNLNQITKKPDAPAAKRRMSRRQFLTVGGGAALGLTLAACTPAATNTGPTAGPSTISQAPRQIVVSTWGGVTEEALKKVVAPVFEEKYNATLAYDIGGASARFTKLVAEAANPQTTVFLNSDGLLYSAKQQNLLAELSLANIPNAAKVHDWAKPAALEGQGIGYTVLSLGMLKLNGSVQAEATSWKDLWLDEFKNKLAFIAPGNGFMPAMLILVAELFGGSQDDIDPGLEALAALRPAAQTFFWTDYAAQLKAGEITMATEMDYYALFMQQDGYDVSWILPQEKAIAQLSSAAVVKNAPHPDLGEALIDTLLDPDIQAQLAKEIYNPPTHMDVTIDADLADKVMYGSRLEQLRWFDLALIDQHRAEWIERINTEVVPQWQS